MRKTTSFLFLTIVFPVLLTAFYPSFPTLDEALVAYYSFNNCDARDDSGNGSDGEMFGHVSCWCGIEDKGLLFDGQNDYVTFSGMVNDYFSTSDFTVSFYFKTEQNTIFKQSMLSKRSDCGEEHLLDFQLDVNGNELVTLVKENEAKHYGDLSPKIEKTGWHHIVLVRQGRVAYTYINGQLSKKGYRCSGVDISNDALLAFSNSPCIGRGGARRFKGILDELRIFDKALSPVEVQWLYDQFPIENADSDCYT